VPALFATFPSTNTLPTPKHIKLLNSNSQHQLCLILRRWMKIEEFTKQAISQTWHCYIVVYEQTQLLSNTNCHAHTEETSNVQQ
jgi:hypothetical protein